MIDKSYRGSITIDYKAPGKWFGHLELKTKFTFVQGFSGTGKTTILEHLRNRKTQIKVSNGYVCKTLLVSQIESSENLAKTLDDMSGGKPTIFCLDEDEYDYVHPNDQVILASTDYLFLVAFRGPWQGIAYGVQSFKKVCCDKLGNHSAYYYLEDLYPEFDKLPKTFSEIFTEDFKSGLKFFQLLVGDGSICNSVHYYDIEKQKADLKKQGGAANVPYTIMDPNSKNSLIIADKLGLGSKIADCIKALDYNPTVTLYLIDSFERMVIISEFIQNGLNKHQNFAELGMSAPILTANAEAYYTDILQKLFKGPLDNGHSSYDKSGLPDCLKIQCCKLARRSCIFFNPGHLSDPELNKFQLIAPKELFNLLVSKRAELASLKTNKSNLGYGELESGEDSDEQVSEDLTTHSIFSQNSQGVD